MKMTNKEAIAILEEVKTIDDSMYQYNPAYLEALEIAIKALEQEPIVINEIPKDYKYDTETEDFLVYRHKYTGNEIHIERPVPRYKLEQELCENAVDRDTIIREMEKRHKEGDAITLGYIKNLPSVTPKQRTGKWVKDKNLYKCTACNELCTQAGWASCISKEQIYKAFKYCPNCGAKMEGESE